ncbi:MAG: zinc-binding alcohol dehydrogenase [Candidatus Limnocylindrales bacterium]
MAPTALDLVASGLIGGRTVQITQGGMVECRTYETPPLADGDVRVHTVLSAISPGTEMTFYGAAPSNLYLRRHWDKDLRLFVEGTPSMQYPITFGYRAAGEVIESRDAGVPIGHRVFGNWRHTEYILMPGTQALEQTLPAELSWSDGVDIGQMGPICVNGVAFAEGEHRGTPVVVFGAGPVGLITAQVARADGASKVYVVDRIPSRLSLARDLGLEPIEAASGIDVAAVLKRRHGSEGIPVAFEATGSSSALHEAIRVVRRTGLVVALGFYQGEAVGLRLGEEFHHNGIRVVCGQIGNIHASWSWGALRARTRDLALAGELVLGGLSRLVVPVEKVAEGFAALSPPAEVLQVALDYSER